MRLRSMVPFRFALCGLTLLRLTLAGGPDGLNQQYCSNDNTGSDYSVSTAQFQSNGLCFDECKESYAFAVVQGHDCWCSNYIPATQQDTSSCSQTCPGFKEDLCGNPGENLFGYIPIPYHSPSGTAGTASSTSAPSSTLPPTSTAPSSTTEPSSTEDPSTSSTDAPTSYTASTSTDSTTDTPTSTSIPPSTFTSISLSVSPTTVIAPLPSTSQSSSSSPSISATPSPVTSVRVVTISGAIVTQTVTSTPMVVNPDTSDQTPSQHHKGLSAGAIAAVVIGSLLGFAALALGLFFLWRRSRRQDAQGGKTRPKRTTSVLSRTGLLSRGRPQSMAENNNNNHYEEYVNTGTGQSSTRHSMFFGAGAAGEGDGVSPVSPLGSSHDTNDALSSRRFSRPRVHDQRLNPSAIFANSDANGSRVSMQDQTDYSRPLGVANPDIRPSFESRKSHA